MKYKSMRNLFYGLLAAALICIAFATAKSSFGAAMLAVVVILIDVLGVPLFWRCHHCGKPLGKMDALKFCPHCGKPLGDEEPKA